MSADQKNSFEILKQNLENRKILSTSNENWEIFKLHSKITPLSTKFDNTVCNITYPPEIQSYAFPNVSKSLDSKTNRMCNQYLDQLCTSQSKKMNQHANMGVHRNLLNKRTSQPPKSSVSFPVINSAVPNSSGSNKFGIKMQQSINSNEPLKLPHKNDDLISDEKYGIRASLLRRKQRTAEARIFQQTFLTDKFNTSYLQKLNFENNTRYKFSPSVNTLLKNIGDYKFNRSYLTSRRKFNSEYNIKSSVNSRPTHTYKFGNIMYDPRIFRGNTYSQKSTLTIGEFYDAQSQDIKKKQDGKTSVKSKFKRPEKLTRFTPPPVKGRDHKPIQTEFFLEEITDKIEEIDVFCQTDKFLDRPPTPLFVPSKIGTDAATQIWENDLWDFDREVQPILEVLVSKTIEQGLLEILQEEELAILRRQQRRFEELRNIEKLEVKRLEEQERQLQKEKEKRLKQQLEIQQLEEETARHVAVNTFAHGYISDLLPSVFNNLQQAGYFYDSVERELQQELMPVLLDDLNYEVQQEIIVRRLTDAIIRDACISRLKNVSKRTLNLDLSDMAFEKYSKDSDINMSNQYPFIPPWSIDTNNYYPPGFPIIQAPNENLSNITQSREKQEEEIIEKLKKKYANHEKLQIMETVSEDIEAESRNDDKSLEE